MHFLFPYFRFRAKKAKASLFRCLCSHSSTFDSRTSPYVLFLEEATWSPETCCFCWTAFRRHKQKPVCVFVFPMIWQFFASSCWAEVSGLRSELWLYLVLHGGKLKQLLFKVMLSSGRKLALLQIHLPISTSLYGSNQPATTSWWACRLIFGVIREEYYPVWSHWAFSALIPELLESILRAAVRDPGAWVPSFLASHSSAMSSHTLPPPSVPPQMWTLLRWWQKQSVESQPISALWLLSWNMVAELGGRRVRNAPLVLPPTLPHLGRV